MEALRKASLKVAMITVTGKRKGAGDDENPAGEHQALDLHI